MTRFPRLAAAVLGLTLFAAPVAMAEGAMIAPETQAKVTADLTAQGYEVRKMEMEDGLLEVYAVKDGKTWQLFLDAELKVVKTCTDNTCEEGEND